jgi:hypothetical protein
MLTSLWHYSKDSAQAGSNMYFDRRARKPNNISFLKRLILSPHLCGLFCIIGYIVSLQKIKAGAKTDE